METIALGMPGGSEVLLVLFVILLFFGAKKLPELSRSLGKSLGEFKKGKEDLEKEIRDMQRAEQRKAAAKPEPKPVEPTEPMTESGKQANEAGQEKDGTE